MDDTLRYKTGARRIWATIVDSIVFLPLIVIHHFLIEPSANVYSHFVWEVFITVLGLTYTIFLHHKTGQTIGKWVARVIVLDVSESRKLTLRQAIYRDSVLCIISFVGIVYFSIVLFRTGDENEAVLTYATFSNWPVLIWTVLEIVTMLTNNKRRAIHDWMARSVVIRSEPAASII